MQNAQTGIVINLKQCQLFRGLDEEILTTIASFSSIKTLPKGKFLFRESEPATGFYVLQTGLVQLHRTSSDGKEQILSIIKENESFAEMNITSLDTYPANALALTASQVLHIPKTDFCDLMLQKPELSLRVMNALNLHMKNLIDLIDDLQLKQIESRFAYWLTKNCSTELGNPASTATIPLKKKTLAGQLGVTSETLSRTLAKFQDESLIEVSGNSVRISNCSGLLKYLNEGYPQFPCQTVCTAALQNPGTKLPCEISRHSSDANK